jgi:hypothetical protein
MSWNPPERDWKYIRSVSDDLLAALCGRINRECLSILKKNSTSEHDKYLALYRHVKEYGSPTLAVDFVQIHSIVSRNQN